MNNVYSTNRAIALFLARWVLGLIFLMAGIYKVFRLGPVAHAERYFLPSQDTFLPTWSLWATGLSIPFLELVAGALVRTGWRIREALIGRGVGRVIETFWPLPQQ